MVLAGRIQLDAAGLASLGVVGSSALIDHAPSLDHARTHAAELLRARASDLVRTWAVSLAPAPPGRARSPLSRLPDRAVGSAGGRSHRPIRKPARSRAVVA